VVEECGISERVRFVGPVAHESVGAYLAACDILCAPYESASDFYFSPLKIAEYLAVGRAVVASSVGPLTDLLGENPGAVTVPPGDEQALARTLTELAKIPTSKPLPHGVAYDPNGRWVFISAESVGADPGAVDVIDLDSRTRVASIAVPRQPTGITILPTP